VGSQEAKRFQRATDRHVRPGLVEGISPAELYVDPNPPLKRNVRKVRRTKMVKRRVKKIREPQPQQSKSQTSVNKSVSEGKISSNVPSKEQPAVVTEDSSSVIVITNVITETKRQKVRTLMGESGPIDLEIPLSVSTLGSKSRIIANSSKILAIASSRLRNIFSRKKGGKKARKPRRRKRKKSKQQKASPSLEKEEEERVLSPLTKKKDMLQKLEQLKLSTPAADTDTLKKLEQMTIEYNDAYEKTQAMLDYYKKSRDDYYKRTFQQQAVARKRRASLESGLVEGNAKRLRNQLNTYARRRSDPETGMWHETVDDWWKMVDRFEAAKARNRRQKVYKGMERAKIPDTPKLRNELQKVWQDSQRAVREGAMRKDHQQYYEKQMQEAIHESMREHGENIPKKKE